MIKVMHGFCENEKRGDRFLRERERLSRLIFTDFLNLGWAWSERWVSARLRDETTCRKGRFKKQAVVLSSLRG